MRMFVAALLGGFAAAVQAQLPASSLETPVLVRAVEKGELLSAADFAMEPRSAGIARGALAPAEASGKEAVRRLVAGAPVRSFDITRPQLVRRGEPVTIVVRSGSLSITAQGRALSGGGTGDLVRVVNAVTNRTVEGTVEKSGQVRILAP